MFPVVGWLGVWSKICALHLCFWVSKTETWCFVLVCCSGAKFRESVCLWSWACNCSCFICCDWCLTQTFWPLSFDLGKSAELGCIKNGVWPKKLKLKRSWWFSYIMNPKLHHFSHQLDHPPLKEIGNRFWGSLILLNSIFVTDLQLWPFTLILAECKRPSVRKSSRFYRSIFFKY